MVEELKKSRQRYLNSMVQKCKKKKKSEKWMNEIPSSLCHAFPKVYIQYLTNVCKKSARLNYVNLCTHCKIDINFKKGR